MQKTKLIISTYDDVKNPNYGGGGAVAVHEIAKRLKDKYDLRIVSWNHSGVKTEIIDGVLYERVGLPFIDPKIAMLVFQVALPFIARFKRHDIWLESFGPPLTTSFMPLVNKKQVVGVVHMLASEDMHRKYGSIVPFKKIEEAGIKRYKRIIATNDIIKRKVLNISPGSHVTVISNGVDKVARVKGRKSKSILFLGRIEIDQKGLDLLILAFKRFLVEESSYKLVIAGGGANKEISKLMTLIKENKLEENVIVKGRVYGKEKDDLLSRAAVIVIPSRFETYSIIALEAMAYGLPIVCFDIEGLRWVSKKAALKVKNIDEKSLANAIMEIVKDEKKIAQMRSYGPVYASKFTWARIADDYHKYLGGILK